MSAPDVRQIGNRWQVVRLIGQGGMSWVFEVTDPRLGVTRALKMLKPAAASSAGYKSFLREAQILARKEDDYLVRIYDLDKDPITGNDYYVMELLSGTDLKQFLKQNGPFPAARAVEVFAGVLQALGTLHAESPPIIHRDIKPGNIQITQSGRPKLLDLGIAKVTRKSQDETVFGDASTAFETFKGTVLYASPEHLAIQELGPQADVFAMGLCLYEALEGHHAYSDVAGMPDLTNSHALYQDVSRFYMRLELLHGKLDVAFKRTPRALQVVIRKALEIEARLRFQDANEMRVALLNPEALSARTTQENAGSIRPPKPQTPLLEPKPKPAPVHDEEPGFEESRGEPSSPGWASWKTALAGLAIASCLGAATWLLWPSPPPDTQAEARTLPETPPPPPVSEPTEEQRSARSTARERVEHAAAAELRDEARTLVDEAKRLQSEADDAWSSRGYVAAAAKYGAAADKAAEALRVNELVPETPTVQDARTLAEVAAARRDAEAVKASLNAAEDWKSGTESQAADHATHNSDAYDAYTRARESSLRAIEDAKRLLATAESARGDCASIESGAAQCKSGEAALAKGKLALANMDAPAATSAFRAAQRDFRTAVAPLTLRVEPAGPVAVEAGKVQRFQAATNPPGALVKFSVQPPGGAQPYTASGASYAFVPGQPGEYRITVTASDARKKQAAPVVILATATALAPVAPDTADADQKRDEAKALLREFKIAIETRNMNRLKAVWRIDTESADGFQHLFDNADDIKVIAEPLGTIQARGADRGTLRFRQRVTTTMQGETQDIVPLAPYRAELIRQHDGWRIIGLRQE